MRGNRVNVNGPATKGPAELNYYKQDEQKEVRDGVAGDGHGLSEEDESRFNENADANHGRKELVRPQAIEQRPQQQPQGSAVRWEGFLPLRSLKVLLVENDDSTRHVVSALLRNCCYEVTAVANAIEAWKILEDLTNRIDLVLTEVVMPYLTGIGLLSKIMSHKTCKNIPVIMMSSNDSMGIVFKCLSKGAVDFLVKPIRKNELKNLWQHVWRKCHSSSGSGSESGIRVRSRSIEGSGNNTGSNDEDDNTSIGVNVRDGSDNGSGTQNSWTKRAVEVDSPQPMSPWDQLSDPPDSTFAQVIHSMPEAFCKNRVATTTTRVCQGKGDELDNIAMGKGLEIGVLRNPDLQLQEQSKKVSTDLSGANKEKSFKLEFKKYGENLEMDILGRTGEIPNGELRKEVADLNVAITNSADPQMECFAVEVPNDISNTNTKGKVIFDNKEITSLELSLKRLRNVGEIGNSAQERNVLKHSAFSRYNTTSTANQTPTGNVGIWSPLDNSSEAAKTELMQNVQSNSNCTPNQRSNGSSNNIDMGSTMNNAFTKPAAFSDKPMPNSAVNIRPSSAFQPVQNGHVSSLQSVVPGKADAATVNSVKAPTRSMQPQVQVQHHHHHYHHHHHHVHNMQQQQQQQLPNHEDSSLGTMVTETPQCGPSNVSNTPIEGNAANYSLNESAAGSNNGSNGQNGCSTAGNTEGTNVTSDDGLAENCGAGGGGSASGSRSAVDQKLSTQREAALNKFRQKRKERCFEKKVRYQSRKRLAEQRPRVRGQFVRQIQQENKSNDKD